MRLSAAAAAGALRAAGYSTRLARRLRRWRPDVVHTNSLKAGVYGTVAARMAGIPSVWHVHDRISRDYLPAQAVVLVRQLAKTLPDAVIANSESTLATLQLPAGQGTVVPSYFISSGSAVGERSLNQDEHRRTDPSLVVGLVGRIAPWKGQHVFLRAFSQAFPEGPERAVIVGAPLFGQDEAAYADGLKSLAEELEVAGRVDFRRFRSDVAGEFEKMDIAVHASIVPEPFGLVVVEAMAAGLPVVAADAGGPAEIITDEVDGLLYPLGDVEALAATLRRLAGDASWRARLGAAARERASNFTPESVVARLMHVYERVLRPK